MNLESAEFALKAMRAYGGEPDYETVLEKLSGEVKSGD